MYLPDIPLNQRPTSPESPLDTNKTHCSKFAWGDYSLCSQESSLEQLNSIFSFPNCFYMYFWINVKIKNLSKCFRCTEWKWIKMSITLWPIENTPILYELVAYKWGRARTELSLTLFFLHSNVFRARKIPWEWKSCFIFPTETFYKEAALGVRARENKNEIILTLFNKRKFIIRILMSLSLLISKINHHREKY